MSNEHGTVLAILFVCFLSLTGCMGASISLPLQAWFKCLWIQPDHLSSFLAWRLLYSPTAVLLVTDLRGSLGAILISTQRMLSLRNFTR